MKSLEAVSVGLKHREVRGRIDKLREELRSLDDMLTRNWNDPNAHICRSLREQQTRIRGFTSQFEGAATGINDALDRLFGAITGAHNFSDAEHPDRPRARDPMTGAEIYP